MKRVIALSALALAVAAFNVSAQEAGGPPPPEGQPPQEGGPQGGPGGQMHRRPPPPLIAALDANDDHVIDAQEIANAAEALKKLDKNGDGKLTREELMPPRPEGQGGPEGMGPGKEAKGMGENQGPGGKPEGLGGGRPSRGGHQQGASLDKAQGQQEGSGSPQQHRRPRPPIASALDANSDGVIDAQEIANATEALKKLDKNGDGKLTPDEVMPPRPQGQGGPGGQGGDRQGPPNFGGDHQGPPPGEQPNP